MTDTEVVAAARFAISKESRKERRRISLVSIEHAERQVVAGMNYRLCLKVETNSKPQEITTVVYRNLKQKFSLTEWKIGSCQKEG